MQRVYQALSLNPDLSPFGAIPLAEKGRQGIGESGVETNTADQAPEQVNPPDEISPDSDQGDESSAPVEEKPKKMRKPSVKIATPNAVVKRLKFGDTGVTCCLDHLERTDRSVSRKVRSSISIGTTRYTSASPGKRKPIF